MSNPLNVAEAVYSIVIGSGRTATKPYELVIGGDQQPEIRVIMTPAEYAVVSALLQRAADSNNHTER